MLKEPDAKEDVAYKLEYSHDNLSYLAVSQILKAEAMVHAQNAKKDIVWSTLERDLKLEPDVWKPMRPVLSQLIRNSIDHGLEQNMDRVQKGKEAQGSVFFDYSQTLHSGQAWHEFIIRDDGRGMEADKIFLRAVRLGLVAEEQEGEFSTSEKLRLILLPGFTTREEVSATSGRGVGMDVVKVVVADELQGEIRI